MSLILSFISATVCYQVLNNLSAKKVKGNLKYQFIIILTSIMYIIEVLEITTSKILILCLVYYLANRIFFKETNEDSIINIIILVSTAIISEILIMVSIIGLNPKDLDSNMIYIVSSTTLFIILLLGVKTRLFKIMKNKIKYVCKNYRRILYAIISEVLIYLFFGIIIYDFIFNDINKYVIYILFIIISVFFIVFQFVLIKLVNSKKERDARMSVIENYEVLLEQEKTEKHNLREKLVAVKFVEKEQVNELVDEILFSIEKKESNLSQFSKLPPSLMAFLYERVSHLENGVVIIDCHIEKDLSKLMKMRTYLQFIQALGISINNALEATKNLDKYFIKISIKESKEEVICIVQNTMHDKIDLENLINSKYSTKNRNSGYGLKSIGQMSKVKLSIDLNEEVFEIKFKSKKNANN